MRIRLSRGWLVLTVIGLVAAVMIAPSEVRSVDVAEVARDVGDVVRARGQASAHRHEQARALMGGGDVLFRDTVRTGADTRLEISFVDDSLLTLGDDSELLIDEMVYDPQGASQGALTLTRGVFRMVSGQLTKTPGGSLTLTTPLATIGVRGTDFWGDQREDKLTMALLDDGELTIVTPVGTVTLTTPLSAVVIERGKAPPAPFTLTPAQLDAAVKTIAW